MIEDVCPVVRSMQVSDGSSAMYSLLLYNFASLSQLVLVLPHNTSLPLHVQEHELKAKLISTSDDKNDAYLSLPTTK